MARTFGHAEYDDEADALYVAIRDVEVARTTAIDDHRLVDYGPDGLAVGYEFIDASEGIDLADAGRDRDRIEALIAESGLPIRILA